MLNFSLWFNFFGEDFQANLEIEVYDYGSPESGRFGPPENYDPGSAPDFRVISITLQQDRPEGQGPHFEATGKLFSTLCRHFDDEILQAISEHEFDRYWFDEDYYRGER